MKYNCQFSYVFVFRLPASNSKVNKRNKMKKGRNTKEKVLYCVRCVSKVIYEVESRPAGDWQSRRRKATQATGDLNGRCFLARFFLVLELARRKPVVFIIVTISLPLVRCLRNYYAPEKPCFVCKKTCSFLLSFPSFFFFFLYFYRSKCTSRLLFLHFVKKYNELFSCNFLRVF